MMDIDEYTLERVKSDVARRFPFYDFRLARDGLVFFCKIREDTLDRDFDDLRGSLSRYGFIPILRREGGEDIIYIVKAKKRREIPLWVNIVLLIATIVTTVITGSLLVCGESNLWNMKALDKILNGSNLLEGFLQFSLPLLTILGVHEMAHYYTSKIHRVRTSLPFFIPVPPILGLNIGTFGALISSREPIPNRKALFDIGISGPLAGFIVAIPVSIYGIVNSVPVPLDTIKGEIMLRPPPLFEIISTYLLSLPHNYVLLLHPAAFAGWVGLLVTAINLFPIGQLDGGHIARAVFGENQRYVGWVMVIVLALTGWLFFAIFVVLVIGIYHPPPLNDISPIDKKRKIMFLVSMIVLILSFTSYPIIQI